MDGVSYANGLNWQFRCLNLLGGSNKIENRANRESEPFLESDDDYDYDEYESVELDTAKKANKAWPSILSSIGIKIKDYHLNNAENRGVSRPRDVQNKANPWPAAGILSSLGI